MGLEAPRDVIPLWLKAAHVAAIVAWVGGMIANAVVAASLRAAGRPLGVQALAILRYVRRWDRAATTPAMFATWAIGLALAMIGGWFPARWLVVKLVFVVALSGLHGMQVGTLRRLASGADRAAPSQRWTAAAIVAAVAVIAVLAIVKPF